MTDVKALQSERAQLFEDVYSGKIPKRVPIWLNFMFDGAVKYCEQKGALPEGVGLREVSWDPGLWFDVLDYTNPLVCSDISPIALLNRYPAYYQTLNAKSFVMGNTGTMQHPEVHSLEPEEYDEFIKDPFTFMLEVLMPRIYPALDTTPGKRSLIWAQAVKIMEKTEETARKTMGAISEKYGYPAQPTGRSTAPLDYLADFFRSFTGISVDVRRRPEKVKEACEKLIPIILSETYGFKDPASLPKTFRATIPLHMGSFLNNKQFEELYWPSWKKVMDALVSYGHGVNIFVEHDWMRYLDYLKSFDGNVRMQFEYGDPKLVKDKLGDTKHTVTGLFAVNNLKYNNVQQIKDSAKELIDILAPGGGYIFGFDKNMIQMSDEIIDKTRALSEFVLDYGKYKEVYV